MEKKSGGQSTTLRLSGHMQAEHLRSEGTNERQRTRTVLDLDEVTLVDVHVVRFLGRCEQEGTELLHCPLYIREWISQESGNSEQTASRRANMSKLLDLNWDVFVTPGIPLSRATRSGTKQQMWSPISSTSSTASGTPSSSTPFHRRAGRRPGGLGRGERQEPDDDLRYARPRRSFLQRQYSSPTISARPPGCDAGCSQDDAPAGIAAGPRRRSGIRVFPVRFPIIL